MNEEQKVLFRQLQFAGLGIVLMIMGILVENKTLIFVGLGILIYGMIRFYMIQKLVNKMKEDE